MSSPVSYATLVPISAPKSLRVLGIISMIIAGITIVLTIVLGCITVSALNEFHVERQYTAWVIGLNVASAGLSAMELLAGIGMTCLKRWGRTLGLVCAFSSIPVSVLICLGFVVVIALVNVSLEQHGGSANMETKVYMGTGCYGFPFTIVLIAMLLSGDIRKWAKSPRGGVGGSQGGGGSAGAVVAPASGPPANADVGREGLTLSGTAALSFAPKVPPKSAAAGRTVSAEVPLGIGGGAFAAATANQVVFSSAAPSRIAGTGALPGAGVARQAGSSQLSSTALWSFILSMMPFIPVLGHFTALLLGIIAIKRINRSNGALRGKGMAVTGIILSSLGLLLCAAIITVVVVSVWERRDSLARHTVETMPAPQVDQGDSDVEGEGQMIRSSIDGRVVSVVAGGTRVGDGDVLVRLDDREASIRLQQAEADLALEKTRCDRCQKDFNDVPGDDVEKAIAKNNALVLAKKAVDLSEKEVAAAKEAMDAYMIRAEGAGRVGRVNVEVGETVRAGQDLLVFYGRGRVQLRSRLQFRFVRRAEDVSSPVDELADPDRPAVKLPVLQEVMLDETSLESAGLDPDGPGAGPIQMQIVFTVAGGKLFQTITHNHIDQQLAIVWDGAILSAPTIRSEIPDGHAIITLPSGASWSDAEKLVAALNAAAGKGSRVRRP